MSGVTYLAPHVGILVACAMLAVARASYYLRPVWLPTEVWINRSEPEVASEDAAQ